MTTSNHAFEPDEVVVMTMGSDGRAFGNSPLNGNTYLVRIGKKVTSRFIGVDDPHYNVTVERLLCQVTTRRALDMGVRLPEVPARMLSRLTPDMVGNELAK